MTTSCGAQMSTEPPPKGDDPLARLLSGVVECWDHTTSVMQQTRAGTYDAADARRDLAKCSEKATEIGLALFTDWLDMLRPPSRNVQPNPSSASTDLYFRPSKQPPQGEPPPPPEPPLELYTDGLRGIGWASDFQIAGGDVTFSPAVVHPDTNAPVDPIRFPSGTVPVIKVTATVSFEHVSAPEREHTIIYEGVVRAHGIQGLVTDTIRVAKPAH